MENIKKDEAFANLWSIRKEVDLLSKRLNSANQKKEALFKNKEKISRQIGSLIRELKTSRKTRDDLTKQVKENKEKRKELNRKILESIEKAKELNKERKALLNKHKINYDPIKLKKEIDGLEMKIETEVMSFANEQKYMVLIKEKKKILSETKIVGDVFDRLSALSGEIDNLKKKADEVHKKVQTKATVSQEKHEEIISDSKDIDELRKKEKEANEKFEAAKKEFDYINKELEEKLILLKNFSGVVQGARTASEKKRRNNVEEILKQKEREVEEKIRKTGKLTTEDLLKLAR